MVGNSVHSPSRFFNTLPEAMNLTVGDMFFQAGPGQMSQNKTVERQK